MSAPPRILALRLLASLGVLFGLLLVPSPARAQDTGFDMDDLDALPEEGPADPPPVDDDFGDASEDPGEPDGDGTDVEATTIDIGGDMSFDLDLNSVLVATFETRQTFLEPEAERVKALVEDALRSAYVVVTMAEVPQFTDYDAEVYLRSCPDGQYIGCVFVVGGRAKTDWTVGGSLEAVDGGYKANLSFIDVSDAKLVLEFDVVLDGSNDQEFQDGVLRIMDALVNDQVQNLDLRGDPAAQRAAEAEAAERARRAKDFAADSIYEDPDDLDRGEVGMDAYVGGEGERSGGKVRMSDLDDMETQGGLTPWERAGLTKGQYRMYRNSGAKLRDFKDKLRGRKGQILIRVSGNVGSGPWAQEHESYLALAQGSDPNNFGSGDVVDEMVVLRQNTALGIGGQLELAVGATPWLDIGAFFGIKSAPYRSRFFVQVPNRDQAPPEYASTSSVTWNAGLRIGVAPGPAWKGRPTLHLGASYWKGVRVARVVNDVPEFLTALQTRPNNFVLMHIQPGGEVDLGRLVQIWVRADIDIPVIGRSLQVFRTQGGDTLDPVPNTTTQNGLSIGGSLGLTFRIRPGG